MKKNYNEIKQLKKSFLNAFKGVFYCIKNERNIRIHMVVGVFIFTFSFFFKLSSIEYAILTISVGFVICCEIFNTAIEALVNLSSPSYNSWAKIAKDVAAGGVFFSSLVAICVGIFLFAKKDKLIKTIILIFSRWYIILIFVFILVFGLFFIFKSFKLKITEKVIGAEEVKIYKPKNKKKF